jgi:putative ATPase
MTKRRTTLRHCFCFYKINSGSDNGAVYWLARMIEGGEDVKFIARRMLILSSEDIGNANPTAFIMANNTFQAVATIDILKEYY